MAEIKLLPCPFCGGKVEIDIIPPHKHYFINFPDFEGSANIECTSCDFVMCGSSPEEVAERWNKRADNKIALWLQKEPDNSYVWTPFICSNCNMSVGKNQTPFCPYCGATIVGSRRITNES